MENVQRERYWGYIEGLLLMELVTYRLPQGLATSCPRALRPGTIPPMNQHYRDGREFLLLLKEFSRSLEGPVG